MDNIEQFNYVVVWIFAKIYGEFPNPTILKLNDFNCDIGLNDINTEIFGSTIEFLEREGFITVGDSSDDGSHFLFVVLTMKGLDILGSVPSSIKDEQNLGQQTQSLVRIGFKEVGKEVLKAVVSEIIKTAAH